MAELTFVPEEVERFWWFSRERYQILLNRQAGRPWPWTDDVHLQTRQFCNVFRSDDKTSQAVARLAGRIGPFHGAVVGRLINKPETLDLISYLRDVRPAVEARGLNTNAYRLNTPLGLNQAEGLYLMMDAARPKLIRIHLAKNIPEALRVLREVPCLGGFVGYQVALDLVEFGFFVPDFVDDWTYPGLGADRGAATLLGRREDTFRHGVETWQNRKRPGPEKLATTDLKTLQTQAVIRQLLVDSRDPSRWPWVDRPWSIHEAEGQLCEYDKYVRCLSGSMGGRRFRAPTRETEEIT